MNVDNMHNNLRDEQSFAGDQFEEEVDPTQLIVVGRPSESGSTSGLLTASDRDPSSTYTVDDLYVLSRKRSFWASLFRGKYTLSEADERGVGEMLRGVDSEEYVPVEEEQNSVRLIDDPTNHDRIAMYYVMKCRLNLPDIEQRTEANRVRASKWICAELSSKQGLRLKHLDRIRVKFLSLLFINHVSDIEAAIFEASRNMYERTQLPDYNHVQRGWFGWLRPRGRRAGFRQA